MTMIISGSDGLEFPDGSDQATAFTGNAATITSGTIATARLATGTANSSTYLRGDQTWAAVPSPTPGGSNTYVQYNNAGAFGGDSGFVYSSGNVGIGTSSPSAPLQVNGTATAARATSAQLWLSRTTTSTQYQGVCLRGGPATDGFVGRAPNSDNIIFGFDGGSSLTTQMSLNNGGDLQFNSGYGSVATAYGCRVWVNWNGQGTPSIRGSGGASSITDNGTGDYTVNYSITLPDANYCALVTNDHDDGSGSNQQAFVLTSSNSSYANKSTTAIRVQVYNTTSADFDPYGMNLAVFR